MNIFKAIALMVLLSLSLHAIEKKVVINLTSGDSHVISKELVDNIKSIAQHYEKQGDTLKAVVVISGESYGLFVENIEHSPYKGKLKQDNEMISGLKSLHQDYKVVFKMCQSGMKNRKIDPKALYKYVEHDRNKSIYLIDYQNDGYAYMEVK